MVAAPSSSSLVGPAAVPVVSDGRDHRGGNLRQNIIGLSGIILVMGVLQAFHSTNNLKGPASTAEVNLAISLNQQLFRAGGGQEASLYRALKGSSNAGVGDAGVVISGHSSTSSSRREKGAAMLEPIDAVFQQVAEGVISLRTPSIPSPEVGYAAGLCNPYSRSCSCHQGWDPEGRSGLCEGLQSHVKLGRRSKTNITKPFVHLSVLSEGLVETSGLHHCEESLCMVSHGHDSSADGYLKSCSDHSMTERRAWQELVVSGMGDGDSCQPDRPFEYPGVDAWAGERPHVGVESHLYTSWVDAHPSLFALEPLPLSERKLVAVAMAAVDVSMDADVVALSSFVPITTSDGKLVMEGGGGGGDGGMTPVQRGDEQLDCSAFEPAIEGPSSSFSHLRAKRLCGLYYRPFLIIPAKTPSSTMAEVFDALRMGCVPVFLGQQAQAYLEVLPANSIILLDDFEQGIQGLGSYLQGLMMKTGDHASLTKHLAWKANPEGWSAAFYQQLDQQSGNLACRVCDHVASRKDINMNKVFDTVAMLQEPPPDTIPPCAAKILQAGKFWQPLEAQAPPSSRIKGIDQIYVVHYTRLPDRREHIVNAIMEMGIGGGMIMASYDREELSDDDIKCFWRPDDEYPMVSGQFSLAIKHFMAYLDMIQRGYESILIIEDDIVMHGVETSSFRSELEKTMSHVPADYQMVFVGGCHGIWRANGESVGDNLVRCRTSVCGSAYIITRDAAIKMLEAIPFYQPVDWHMNRVKAAFNMPFYQVFPPLLKQGVGDFKQSTSVEA